MIAAIASPEEYGHFHRSDCRNTNLHTHTNSRTPPTCDVSLGSVTLPASEAGDFEELILLYVYVFRIVSILHVLPLIFYVQISYLFSLLRSDVVLILLLLCSLNLCSSPRLRDQLSYPHETGKALVGLISSYIFLCETRPVWCFRIGVHMNMKRFYACKRHRISITAHSEPWTSWGGIPAVFPNVWPYMTMTNETSCPNRFIVRWRGGGVGEPQVPVG
jgi:hypothetical protein